MCLPYPILDNQILLQHISVVTYAMSPSIIAPTLTSIDLHLKKTLFRRIQLDGMRSIGGLLCGSTHSIFQAMNESKVLKATIWNQARKYFTCIPFQKYSLQL